MGQSSDTLAADVRRGGSSADGIPFLDLAPVNEVVREKVVAGLQHLFDTNAFVNGPEVVAFEEAYASFCGSPHCVGLASGLDALRIGLIAAGVSAGDEVIVPAQTFVATFEAVTQAGGRPVVVDVDERDYCISVDAVEAALTSRTAAVLPVHLYGQMADVSRLSAFVRQRGLVLLEDAAQAHGATRDGVKAGTAGHVGAFSFYPGKNLGALGDAGALITPDAELASAARALREHGQHVKYQSSVEGYTARLDTIQAIALAAKLEHLDRWTARRRELASLYDKALAGLGDLRLPSVPPASEPVWHLYVVRTADPDGLARALSELGIGSGRHYPIAPHRTDAYAHLGYGPGAFPVAEAISRECLSLPIYPGLSDSQLERVVEGIRGFFGG